MVLSARDSTTRPGVFYVVALSGGWASLVALQALLFMKSLLSGEISTVSIRLSSSRCINLGFNQSGVGNLPLNYSLAVQHFGMADPITPAVPPKKQRERSPNYPAIGLRKALELAQKFWDSDKRQPVLVSRAATNLGFSAKSSAGQLTLAAMKKYGLLDEEGAGDMRKLKLSESAITLLNPSAPNRDELIKQAALKPAIHAELWNKYGAEGGSEGAIHDYLVFDRKFTEPAAKSLIEQYGDTIAFANLGKSDIGDKSNDNKPDAQANKIKVDLPGQPPAKTPPPMTAGLRYLPIPLDIGDAPIPVGMSDGDFDLLIATLNLWKKKIVRPAQEPPNPAKEMMFPRKAIWKNKDNDRPVEIIDIAGDRDGVRYYKSSTGTGIPANELVWE